MIEFITIRLIDKSEPGYIHFSSECGRMWNCNKPELFTGEDGNLAWRTGTRLKIDYNSTNPPAPKKPSKYINNARPARDDEKDTMPYKEPYSGGGGGGSYGGGSVKNEYDTEVSKRQTAANCAMQYFANAGATIADLEDNFASVANIVFEYVNDGPKSDAGATDGESGGTAGSPEDNF